jgi:alpha-glucosidase (family GH31 glycosyl hydrolase)
VTTAGAASRNVYLPEGQWMDYNDKRTVYEGKKSIAAVAPLGTIPLFVREGAIVPRGDIVRLNNNWAENWSSKLRIEIFPSVRTPSEFNYFAGDKVQRITATPETDGLTIRFGDLNAEGTVEVYCRKAAVVMRNGKKLREGNGFKYDAQLQKLTVPFKGATEVVLKGAGSLFNP